MLFHAIVFLVFTYITFKVYPSTAVILTWLFVGLGVFLTYLGQSEGLLMVSYIIYIITLSITAIVTSGDFE